MVILSDGNGVDATSLFPVRGFRHRELKGKALPSCPINPRTFLVVQISLPRDPNLAGAVGYSNFEKQGAFQLFRPMPSTE